jgi:hypothetical protein
VVFILSFSSRTSRLFPCENYSLVLFLKFPNGFKVNFPDLTRTDPENTRARKFVTFAIGALATDPLLREILFHCTDLGELVFEGDHEAVTFGTVSEKTAHESRFVY